ncbi:MAG: phosphate ABC transporter, permease protein PstA, partial [Pseudomonas sp.]|nr:phosphate ABC transporter, permease protein PstA [Pseudomonas sp.]
MKQNNLKTWFKSGTPWIWMNAGAVSIAVIMTLGLLMVIAVRGLGHFWPADVVEVSYQIPGQESRLMAGEISRSEEVPRARLAASGMPVDAAGGEFMTRELLKVGNRDLYGADFSWVVSEWLSNPSTPENLVVLERREWGNFYGYLVNVKENGELVAQGDASWPALQERIARVEKLHTQLVRLEKKDIGRINAGLERIRLNTRRLELQGNLTEVAQAEMDAERAQWDAEYKVLETELIALNQAFNRDSVTVRSTEGREITLTLGKVVRAYQPNAMGNLDKLGFYFVKLWEFVSDEPREANTEGGIFPAIFGTVMMTLIMAVIVTPFGVVAAIYLREYAKQGPLTRVIRIAVNNLAGVP